MIIKDFLSKHIDFKIYPVTIAAIVTALLIIPCVLYLPAKYGYENGILENIQMIFLFLGCFWAIKAPKDKKFFYFAALVLGILIIREVNCGRTLFFAIPGQENAFYSWKEIKYGWLAHPIYGLYIAWVGIYFIINKLYIRLWEIFSRTQLPLWNILLMLTGMVLGMYAEKALHNDVFEEITELLFYVSLTGIIYIYTKYRSDYEA